MRLEQYLDLIRALPLPTRQQREGFAEFVAHAHSWYKHLPYAHPGAPFCFFIDKFAGCDRVAMWDGSLRVKERTENGFHYSDIPTEEYRARFGYLAYSCESGTTVLAPSDRSMVLPRDKIVGVLGDDAWMYALPSEILELGIVGLTAAIHTASAGYPFWVPSSFPAGTDDDKIRLVMERCHTMVDPRFKHIPRTYLGASCVDPELYDLVVAEQQRQRGEIVRTIDQVCDFIATRRPASG